MSELLRERTLDIKGRRLEILKLTAEGKTSVEVAKTLTISYETVKTHKKHLILEFNAKNMAQVISIAYKKGILSTNE